MIKIRISKTLTKFATQNPLSATNKTIRPKRTHVVEMTVLVSAPLQKFLALDQQILFFLLAYEVLD